MADHFVSASCKGEQCAACVRDPDELFSHEATHKASEVILWDDPQWGLTQEDIATGDIHIIADRASQAIRHELTAYLCCQHFQMVFGRCTWP